MREIHEAFASPAFLLKSELLIGKTKNLVFVVDDRNITTNVELSRHPLSRACATNSQPRMRAHTNYKPIKGARHVSDECVGLGRNNGRL